MKKNILITGGTGFIGSQLAELLYNSGNNIYVLSYKKADLKLNYSVITCDLLDGVKLKDLFKDIKIDIIVHLESLSYHKDKFSTILELYRLNVIGFINIFELAFLKSVKKVILASSTKVYGNQYKDAINEVQRFKR